MSDFILTCASFKDGEYLEGEHILSESFAFGCKGGNVSPHLAWTDPPSGTESFTLTLFEPDAPTGHFLLTLILNCYYLTIWLTIQKTP
jgi:hypothetical protein